MDLIISLNKPKDITSQAAVSAVKKILRVKKAGHTGTLDPMATGLLLVCLNRATRLAKYLSPFDKDYNVVMKLGEATDTQDAYGIVIEEFNVIDINTVLIKETLNSFKGRTLQTPPMFSALKHNGKPLYKYAREGIDIARKQREVDIVRIELLGIELPFVRFNVTCSKGTYIRTLCDDIGKKLGVGAHLFDLKRTAIGRFSLSDGLEIEELKSVGPEPIERKGIYTMDSALSWMPELKVNGQMIRAVTHGNPVTADNLLNISDGLRSAPWIRIKSPDGKLLSIGRFDKERQMIKMDIVFGSQ
jgi:tRNA pseudouridine55 synthase